MFTSDTTNSNSAREIIIPKIEIMLVGGGGGQQGLLQVNCALPNCNEQAIAID